MRDWTRARTASAGASAPGRAPGARAPGGSPCCSWSAPRASRSASLPGYVSLVGVGADGVTFFVGSIFFTCAGLPPVPRGRQHGPVPRPSGAALPLASWEPRRIDWFATAVQLAGTLFFNVSTFRAMTRTLRRRAGQTCSSGGPTHSARSASSSRAGLPTPRRVTAGSRGTPAISAGRSPRSTSADRSSSASRRSPARSCPRPVTC